MLRVPLQRTAASVKLLRAPSIRALGTSPALNLGKREGDISDAFASLSNISAELPARFAAIKQDLVANNGPALTSSFHRLLAALAAEIPVIKALGSNVIPSIDYTSLQDPPASFTEAHKRTGLAIIRSVISESQALAWLSELKAYIRANPHTKAFPATKPAVYELYWSWPQLAARSHPHLLETMRFLMSHWHASKASSLFSLTHPVTYADRLRIRPPGDAAFALGPHVDGGSCERWEKAGYGGVSGTYGPVFRGEWESFDPFDVSTRLGRVQDLYQGAGACSAFRMYQGWLALSHTGPGEGTLKVNPLFSRATAYYLLRPFFAPRDPDPLSNHFLRPDNWVLEGQASSHLQGASPGHGQELSAALHPHLELESTMVSIPHVRPGDYIVWHCDTIHAVDSVHMGQEDASVMYIPTCPLTEHNAEYLVRQRAGFIEGAYLSLSYLLPFNAGLRVNQTQR